jgi:hypothetical protein
MKRVLKFTKESINLFKHFSNFYSMPKYKLEHIDYTKLLVHYTNTTNNKSNSIHINGLVGNNKIISNFSSHEAAQIGYIYGTRIQQS